MGSRRLLERIREMARPQAERRPPDPESLQQSILRHLTRILNTRQGSTVIASDYGVPDFSALTTNPNAANLARIEEILCDVVTRYEPRLNNVGVRFVQDPDAPFRMGFSLTADIAGLDGAQIAFQTVLTPSGRINIQRRRAGDEEEA